MLKLQLDNLDGLDDATKALYKEVDGKFLLDLEGYKDPQALLNAKEHEKAERIKAQDLLRDSQAALQAATDRLAEIERDTHRKGNNIAELDASYKKQIDDLKAAHKSEMDKLNGRVSKLLVTSVAERLAAELSDTPELLSELIARRLKVEEGADGPETRVADASGALSAMKIDDLREEFRINPKYAAIIRGSRASGGGAHNDGDGGSAPKKFADMNGSERTALFYSDRAAFDRGTAELKAGAKTG